MPRKQPTLTRVKLDHGFQLPTDSGSQWALDNFVDQVRSKLNKAFWPSIEFYIDTPDWSGHPELVITYARPETNDERKRREFLEQAEKLQAKAKAERQERQELAILKRLKEKYPNA